MPSMPGAPLLRTTARNAASMLSGSQIASIRCSVDARLSGSAVAVIVSTSCTSWRGASPRAPACRVGGGALDCSRAGLRPPLKLGVQFSRTQLSRRRRSLRGNGRDHRNQVHKPVLAVELTAWQRSPTAAAPLVVPVRPDPPHQPSVEPVEELSDLGPLVVVAPTTHDGIDLLYQLSSGHRCATSCEPTNLLLEVVDRFLSGIGIERSPSGTRLDLACRQVHGPAPSLDLVPEEFEAVPNVHIRVFCGLMVTPSFFKTRLAASSAARASTADARVTTQSSAYLVS